MTEETTTESLPEGDWGAAAQRVADELAATQEQRNILGQIVAGWVTRFFALKIANGELPAAALEHMVNRELADVDAAMRQAAGQAQADG